MTNTEQNASAPKGAAKYYSDKPWAVERRAEKLAALKKNGTIVAVMMIVLLCVYSTSHAAPLCEAGSYPVWNGYQWICK